MVQRLTLEQYQEKYGELPSAPSERVQTAISTDVNGETQNATVGFTKGLGKSAVGLVKGLGEFGRGIQRGISRGVDTLTGTKSFGLGDNSMFDPNSERGKRLNEVVTPQTTSERVGRFVGDVAQFAVPAGVAAKATKGAGAVKQLAGQGLSDATVQSIQQGGVDKETLDAAILGVTFPGAGKAASVLKKGIGGKAGGKIINSLIKPLLRDFSYGKNPGKAVAQEGITANSLDDLTNKIRDRRQQVGKQLSDIAASSKELFDAGDAFSPIDGAIAEASKSPRTNASIITRLENLKADLLRVDPDGRVTRRLENLSAEEMVNLKKEIGELTRWTGNPTDDEVVNKALKKTYGRIKGQLDDSINGLKDLNERYANLKSAEIAAEYRDKIASRQNLLSLPGINVGVGGALVGALATGGAITPSLLVGAGAAGVRRALGTPAAKTRVASWLASTPNSELRSLWQEAPWLRSVLQESLFGEKEGEESNTE